MFRPLLICALLIFECLVFIKGEDLYEGYEFGARMSYKEVKKSGLLFFKRHDKLVLIYPEKTKITGVACVDLSPNKKGKAKIKSGGINSNKIELEFESENSAGLKYAVEIYTSAIKKEKNREDNSLQSYNGA